MTVPQHVSSVIKAPSFMSFVKDPVVHYLGGLSVFTQFTHRLCVDLTITPLADDIVFSL